MIKNFLVRFIQDQSGQSLMEIIIGLTIGAILIGTASFGIAFTLRSTTSNQGLANASQMTQGLLNNVQSFSNGNWQNTYGLSKGPGNQYYLNASGTSYIAVQGREGLIDNDVTNGLVGEWKLDEATGTVAYNSTGGNYNGVISFGAGTVRATSTCQIGYCLRMVGGVDQMTLGNFSAYDTPSFSVSYWLKPMSYKTVIGGANGNILMARESYTTSGFRSGIVGTGGTVGQLQFWTTQSGGTLTLSTGSTVLNTNSSAFYHIVVTYNSTSSTGFVYVNGNQAGTGSGNYVPPAGRTLGVDAGTGGVNYLDSYFDDVRWYNRALSAAEVKQLYNTQAFTRYFYVENVCRTNDAAGNITSSSSPCSGGNVDDPLTQKVTAITQWTAGPGIDQVNLSRYLTRWWNFSIRQTDWSGGSGQEGAITNPNDKYSSGLNVLTNPLGSFQIQNLTQQ